MAHVSVFLLNYKNKRSVGPQWKGLGFISDRILGKQKNNCSLTQLLANILCPSFISTLLSYLNTFFSTLFMITFLKIFIYLFLERGERREKERERNIDVGKKHQLVASRIHPDCILRAQPRLVP